MGIRFMLTYDLIYLGLIPLAGVVFYLCGYRAGERKTRKELKHLLSDSEETSGAHTLELEESSPLFVFRGHSSLPQYNKRADFGRN
ncbi:MAG TPA: hypothetical protein VGE41_06515 [Verrucomicrobiae bacterium]|jgi:hypothetical protein